jgi:hypothetical protein
LFERCQVLDHDASDLRDETVDREADAGMLVVGCLVDVEGVEAERLDAALEQRTTGIDTNEGVVEVLRRAVVRGPDSVKYNDRAGPDVVEVG